MPPVAGFLISAVWFLIWGALARSFWHGLQVARATRDWPSVAGQVVGTRIDEERSRGDGRSSRVYRLRVRYAYVVDGVRRTSSRRFAAELAGWTSWGGRKAAERHRARYPVGAPVTAYYDPADPVLAVLETGARWGNWAVFLTTATLCASSVFVLWFCLVLLSPERIG